MEMNVSKLVALVLWIGAAAAAQTTTFWPEGAHDGKAWDIAISGNYAYVADGPGGLIILDVSDPSAPVLVNRVVTNDIRAIEVVDGYAYTACYNDLDTVNSEGVMLIFDVSVPTNIPAPVASSPVSGDGYLDIAVENGYAYLVDRNLEIWDVSDPENPGRVKAPSTSGYANNIKVIDGTAYIAEGQGGLRVYDLSNPSNLYSIATPSGTYDPGYYAYGVDIEWPYAYYANRQGGLVVVDVSDPTDLVGVATYGETAEKVCVYGGIAYVADNTGDIQVLDVTDPSNIVYVTTCTTDGDTLRTTIDSGILYAANGTNGISIIDLRPAISIVSVDPVQLQVDSLFAVPYAVDCAASLEDDWVPFCSTNPASTPFLVQDSAGSFTSQFYRVRQLTLDYSDEVTADAPEAVYQFNESAGATTLTDATGNGHDSLSVSNVTFGATGPVDSAAVFSNGLVELDLQLDPSAGDFSVETLIRFDAAGNVLQQLDGTGTGRAMLYRLSDGSIGSYLGQSSTTADTLVATGAWHHVVMTVEEAGTNDVIRFYIDGKAAGSGMADVESADGNWRIGKGNLVGALDELAVYTNALSAKRIAEHYTALTVSSTVSGVTIAR